MSDLLRQRVLENVRAVSDQTFLIEEFKAFKL